MALPRENYVSISFHIEWDMIMVTVFLSNFNQMEFHLVQNRKENCHHDHIPSNLKGNGNIVSSVWGCIEFSQPHPINRMTPSILATTPLNVACVYVGYVYIVLCLHVYICLHVFLLCLYVYIYVCYIYKFYMFTWLLYCIYIVSNQMKYDLCLLFLYCIYVCCV